MRRDQALELLTLFKNDFADQFGILRIGLFGSTARDCASKESDIDIVIETKTPDMFAVVHAKNRLEELFHTHVDLVRYRETMNPYLKHTIEKEALFV